MMHHVLLPIPHSELNHDLLHERSSFLQKVFDSLDPALPAFLYLYYVVFYISFLNDTVIIGIHL